MKKKDLYVGCHGGAVRSVSLTVLFFFLLIPAVFSNDFAVNSRTFKYNGEYDGLCWDLGGTSSQYVDAICVERIDADVDVSVLMGEPVVRTRAKFRLSPQISLKNSGYVDVSYLSPEVQKVWRKIKPIDLTLGVFFNDRAFLVFDPGDMKSSGSGYSYNTPGSPSWDRLFASEYRFADNKACRRGVGNRVSITDSRMSSIMSYVGKEEAKKILKGGWGYSLGDVGELYLCQFQFGGLSDFDLALEKSCEAFSGEKRSKCEEAKVKKEEKQAEEEKQLEAEVQSQFEEQAPEESRPSGKSLSQTLVRQERIAAKKAEEKRLAEIARKRELARIAREKKAEELRIAEEKRKEEERKRVEAERARLKDQYEKELAQCKNKEDYYQKCLANSCGPRPVRKSYPRGMGFHLTVIPKECWEICGNRRDSQSCERRCEREREADRREAERERIRKAERERIQEAEWKREYEAAMARWTPCVKRSERACRIDGFTDIQSCNATVKKRYGYK